MLVHAQDRSLHAAAYHRQTGQFAQSLYSAVFSVFSVKHRKDCVQTDELQAACARNQKTMVRAVRGKHGRETVGGSPGVCRNPVNIALIAQPGAFPGDADQMSLIFFLIQMGNNRIGRLQGDLVLRRAAAKKNRNHGFIFCCVHFHK